MTSCINSLGKIIECQARVFDKKDDAFLVTFNYKIYYPSKKTIYNQCSWSNIVYVHVQLDLDPIFQNSRKNPTINLSNWKLSSWIWHHQSNKISTALIEISTIKKIVAQWIDSPSFWCIQSNKNKYSAQTIFYIQNYVAGATFCCKQVWFPYSSITHFSIELFLT